MTEIENCDNDIAVIEDIIKNGKKNVVFDVPETEPKEEVAEYSYEYDEEEEPIAIVPKRKPKKATLIDGIVKIKTALGEKVVMRNLQRMKLIQLEKMLGELIEHGCDVSMANEFNAEVPTMQPKDMQSSEHNIEYGTKCLFQINLMVAMIAEQASIKYKDDLGGHLEGYTKKIVDNKDELMPILREIYLENEGVIKNYVSPWTSYLMFMIGTASMSIQKNATIEIKKE